MYQMKLQQNMINPLPRGANATNMSVPANSSIHPILRGASVRFLFSELFCIDSSPPERGKLQVFRNCVASVRFIPSGEGQARGNRRLCKCSQIHPLPRGADPGSGFKFSPVSDSSPPARGRPTLAAKFYHEQRFIPSREGQTNSRFTH